MKIFALCAGCSMLAFVAMGYQAGLFDGSAGKTNQARQETKKEPPPPAPFPEALVEATRGKAISQAASFTAGPGPHRLVFLSVKGTLHDWHDKVREEWQADTVERAELIVLVGKDKKFFVEKITYPNNAPPVFRYRWELDIQVVSPKTGEVLARKRFISQPRHIRKVEDWRLTALGEPVAYKTVFNWVAAQSQVGFSLLDSSPIVTTSRNQ